MTAALEPVGTCVEPIPNIHVSLDGNESLVALSVGVIDSSEPTSRFGLSQDRLSEACEQSDKNLQKYTASALARDKPPGPSSDAAAASPSSELCERAMNIEFSDNKDAGTSIVGCIGPATPELLDTVGVKERRVPSSFTPGEDAKVQNNSGKASSPADPLNCCQQPVLRGKSNTCVVAAGSGVAYNPAPSEPMGRGSDERIMSTDPAGQVLNATVDVNTTKSTWPGPDAPSVAVLKAISLIMEDIRNTAASNPPVKDVVPSNNAGHAAAEPITPTTPPRQLNTAPLLPPPTDPNRMTLVLDLDGTLIASEDDPHAPVAFDYCVDDERFVWLRPGLRRFLDSVRPQFEVVLFTAAGESWATSALQRIDPSGTIFDSRLYRDHTVSHDDWPWVKDLSRLGRDLARVVIVDDNPLMFMYQPDNALHVAAYDPQITGHNDDVLEQVLDVLMHKVLIADDVREVLRNMKEPITASCVAARRAAARANAATHVAQLMRLPGGGGLPTATAIRKGAGAMASAAAAMAFRPTATAVSDMPAAPAAADTASSAVAGTAGQGRNGKRGRRPVKQQQTGGVSFVPGQPAAGAVGSAPVATGLPPAADTLLQGTAGDKKQRSQRSRQRGGGGNVNSAVEAKGPDGRASGASSIRASTGPPPADATAVATVTVSRPPVVVSRVRNPKQPSKRGAPRKAAPSLFQEPEQQLQLKLKLLQLQRQQEEAEEGQVGNEDVRGLGAAVDVLTADQSSGISERSAPVRSPSGHREGGGVRDACGRDALEADSGDVPAARGTAAQGPGARASAFQGLTWCQVVAKERPRLEQFLAMSACGSDLPAPSSGLRSSSSAAPLAYHTASGSASSGAGPRVSGCNGVSLLNGLGHGLHVGRVQNATNASVTADGEVSGGGKRRSRNRRRRRRRGVGVATVDCEALGDEESVA